jgi:hypothetical protein
MSSRNSMTSRRQPQSFTRTIVLPQTRRIPEGRNAPSRARV